MNWTYILIGALIVIYIIQVLIVFKELGEGEYTRKYRVLLDLIPFYFLVLAIIEFGHFLFEVCLENAIDEFKKLK
ncbi:hypothetical protein [Sphingobacterium bovisgrunnientis]|uniref:hypothetical protein n=1 Tax=Sphingobacterium bovisgrunnientis TaxID=1874697 RepID=UPI00135CDE60|nr:hypothetical protein [Sphingobacterium bovisgrunnientis]